MNLESGWLVICSISHQYLAPVDDERVWTGYIQDARLFESYEEAKAWGMMLPNTTAVVYRGREEKQI